MLGSPRPGCLHSLLAQENAICRSISPHPPRPQLASFANALRQANLPTAAKQPLCPMPCTHPTRPQLASCATALRQANLPTAAKQPLCPVPCTHPTRPQLASFANALRQASLSSIGGTQVTSARLLWGGPMGGPGRGCRSAGMVAAGTRCSPSPGLSLHLVLPRTAPTPPTHPATSPGAQQPGPPFCAAALVCPACTQCTKLPTLLTHPATSPGAQQPGLLLGALQRQGDARAAVGEPAGACMVDTSSCFAPPALLA